VSILLDLISTVLTNANSVQKIGTFGDEVGLSQIMIAIDPGKFQSADVTDRIVDELIEDIHSSVPVTEGGKVFYPGEIEIGTRKDNQKNGIPVIEEVWEQIKQF
ncbi:MAG TPA: Ldh family oxidoreductase, partial [Candidatus Enterocloster faecavium]|nr:Ldh family oxidoreductase [Candidatus Enterocloster faecavium]